MAVKRSAFSRQLSTPPRPPDLLIDRYRVNGGRHQAATASTSEVPDDDLRVDLYEVADDDAVSHRAL
ncbi:hypothetical protein GCM10022245_75730 [Streptomyces mayteni]